MRSRLSFSPPHTAARLRTICFCLLKEPPLLFLARVGKGLFFAPDSRVGRDHSGTGSHQPAPIGLASGGNNGLEIEHSAQVCLKRHGGIGVDGHEILRKHETQPDHGGMQSTNEMMNCETLITTTTARSDMDTVREEVSYGPRPAQERAR